MDQIRIQAIRCEAHIGVTEEERRHPQPLEIDVAIFLDLEAAARSDDLEQTVNYHRLTEAVREAVGGSRFQLVEALAGHLCRRILADPLIQSVEVRLRKFPESLRGKAVHAEVTLHRRRLD